MEKIKDFQHVTTSMRDQDEALWFYRDLLGFKRAGRLSYHDDRQFVIDFMEIGNDYLLELFYFKKSLFKLTDRIEDDRQIGMRHMGFRINNLDALAGRLHAAGVEFLTEPAVAPGGVRAALVKDPSGTVVKLVEGDWQYDVRGEGARVPNQPQGDAVVYDHVTLTVSDFEASYNFYHQIFEFPYLGMIRVNEDPNGLEIHHFQIGKAIVELLSYKTPTILYQRNHDNTHVGLRHFGLLVDGVDPVMARLQSAGAPILYPPVDAIGGVRTCFFSDPDTVAIELINGTCTYNG